MILTLYVVGIFALAAFVNWWFLLGLLALAFKLPMLMRRARILNVLKEEYQYEFPAISPQAYTLNRIEREMRSRKLRDEEIATLFMAVMINSLDSNDEDAKAFAGKAAADAGRLVAGGQISGDVFFEINGVAQKKLARSV